MMYSNCSSNPLGGFRELGYPNSWIVYFMKNPNPKWMITRGTPSSGSFHIHNGIYVIIISIEYHVQYFYVPIQMYVYMYLPHDMNTYIYIHIHTYIYIYIHLHAVCIPTSYIHMSMYAIHGLYTYAWYVYICIYSGILDSQVHSTAGRAGSGAQLGTRECEGL